jgi:hypothetical protein
MPPVLLLHYLDVTLPPSAPPRVIQTELSHLTMESANRDNKLYLRMRTETVCPRCEYDTYWSIQLLDTIR